MVVPESELTLRPWRDEDQAAILALERAVWGDSEAVEPAFFDWQYRRNPEGRAVISCAVDPEGMIVAQYATIPIPLRFKGTRIVGSLSLNTATHPDYRRLGLFTKTAMAVYEQLERQGIEYTLGFPNENSYPGFIKKLGFADLGRPKILVKILDPVAFVGGKNVADKWPRFAALVRIVTKGLRWRSSSAAYTHELSGFERLWIEDFWEPVDVVVAADEKWLTWRYVENPIVDYKITVAGNSSAPDGLMVSRSFVQARRGRFGYIMELMVTSEAGLEIVQALIGRAIDDFGAAGCTALCVLASPGSRKFNLLKQCGFFEVPRKFNRVPPLILRKHVADEFEILLRDVDVSFGMFDNL
jgi:GNAT superfamily N-acetyltransferase